MLRNGDRLCAGANLGAEAARRIGECRGERARSADRHNSLPRRATIGAVASNAVEEHGGGGPWAHWTNGVVDGTAPGEHREKVFIVLDVLTHKVCGRHWEDAQDLATIAFF